MEEWASALKEIFGPPENMEKARDPMEYQTPMDTELVAAWVEASGDPETEVPKWLVQGAPLGIELPIHSCGIFPPAEKKEGNSVGEAITQGELEKKGFKNYLSVESNKEDAEAELARYENLGYLRRLPKEEALRDFGGGTISKLGLVVKLKPDQTKKLRIVIDLRRSGGNAKSELPERLVLPRPLDAVQSLREQKRKKVEEGQGDCGAEFALIDISNAFTTLPLHSKELRHSLSPSTKEGEMLQFRALLFGLPAGRPEWTTRDQAVSREEKGPATKSTEEQEEQHSPGLEKERDESSSKRDRKETLHRKGLLQQEWRSPQNFKEEHHQEDPGGSRGLQRRETISGDHEDPGFSLEGGGVQVRAELPHRAEDVAPRRRRAVGQPTRQDIQAVQEGSGTWQRPCSQGPRSPEREEGVHEGASGEGHNLQGEVPSPTIRLWYGVDAARDRDCSLEHRGHRGGLRGEKGHASLAIFEEGPGSFRHEKDAAMLVWTIVLRGMPLLGVHSIGECGGKVQRRELRHSLDQEQGSTQQGHDCKELDQDVRHASGRPLSQTYRSSILHKGRMGRGTGSLPRAMEFQHHPGVCEGGLRRSTGELEDTKDGRRILPSQKAGQRGFIAIPDGHTSQDTDGSQKDEVRLQSGEGKGRGHRGAVGEVGRNRRQPARESTEHA